MAGADWESTPLQDYPNRSLWTTWTISYQEIRRRHEGTANLLLLWSCLDNNDLWYRVFVATARSSDPLAVQMLSEWIGDISSNELAFSRAMQLLGKYSLIEEVQATTSYAIHPLVHRWAYHYHGRNLASKLELLAIMVIEFAIPPEKETWDADTRRILPHVLLGFHWTQQWLKRWCHEASQANLQIEPRNLGIAMFAIQTIGIFYYEQHKYAEAEQVFAQLLPVSLATGGWDHKTTLLTLDMLARFNREKDESAKCEGMLKQALKGYENKFGYEHDYTLGTAYDLGHLYFMQHRLTDAERMLERVVGGRKKTLGFKSSSTLKSIELLGSIYLAQEKLAVANQMFQLAEKGYEETIKCGNSDRLESMERLGSIYLKQNKLAEAERMFERVLQGYAELVGNEHLQECTPALGTMQSLADVYRAQGDTIKAQAMYSKALLGVEALEGHSSRWSKKLRSRLTALSASQSHDAAPFLSSSIHPGDQIPSQSKVQKSVWEEHGPSPGADEDLEVPESKRRKIGL